MSDNWEFALDNTDADYVTVIGDDDGFLPSAIRNAVDVLIKHNTPVLSWRKAEYTWPDYPEVNMRNRLVLPRLNNLLKVNGKEALKLIVSLRLSYSLGPCIYNSLVSKQLLDTIKKRDGKIFRSMCPDVLSSLNLADITDFYLMSSRPFSINGASAASNGTSSVGGNENSIPSQTFVKEYLSSPDHSNSFGMLKGTLTAALLESLIIFSEKNSSVRNQINMGAMFNRILNEISINNALYESNLKTLSDLAEKYGQTATLKKFINSSLRADNKYRQQNPQKKSLRVETIDLLLNTEDFDITNVFQASLLAEKILGCYEIPDQVLNFSYWRYGISKLMQKLQKTSWNLGL